jgi:methionine synthase II (cobalamin-independent)
MLAVKGALQGQVHEPHPRAAHQATKHGSSGYPREQFLDDVIDECERDIRGCFKAGAVRVSIDFTEGRLAKERLAESVDRQEHVEEFIDMNNRLLGAFSAQERRNFGIHTCPGGDCDSVHSKEVRYELLLEPMFDMNAGYFLIQCASEEDREKVYKLCGHYSREDANGVPQVCFMGVINPLSPDVETPEHVKEELLIAATHIPVQRLGATDDCGFSPFSRDLKPKHGSPDFARDVAIQKIRARLDGARLASAQGPASQLSRHE